MVESNVERMKSQADRTREELDQKLTELQDRVGGALDLRSQMARQPWLTLGAAVGVGMLIGYMVTPKRPEPQPWDAEEIRRLLRGRDQREPEQATLMALALPVLSQAARLGLNHLMTRRQERQVRMGRESQARMRNPATRAAYKGPPAYTGK